MPLLCRRQLPALIAALIGGGSVGVRAEPASDQLTESFKRLQLAKMTDSMSARMAECVESVGSLRADQWKIDHYVNVNTHLANPPRPLEVWVRAPAPKFQLAQSVSDSLRRLPKGA